MHGQPTNVMEACMAAIDQYYEDLKESKKAEKDLCAAVTFVNKNYIPESQLYVEANVLTTGNEAKIYEAHKMLLEENFFSSVYTGNYSPTRFMLIICAVVILLNNGKLANETILQEMKRRIDQMD